MIRNPEERAFPHDLERCEMGRGSRLEEFDRGVLTGSDPEGSRKGWVAAEG
jgi:hypothetical protein